MKKLLLIILLIVGCGKGDNTPRDVRYEVTSKVYDAYYPNIPFNSKVSLTLKNQGDNTEQYSSIDSPYSYQLQAKKGQFLYIAAQAEEDNDATVTTKIYVNNQLFKTATSKGRFVIATASGSCP